MLEDIRSAVERLAIARNDINYLLIDYAVLDGSETADDINRAYTLADDAMLVLSKLAARIADHERLEASKSE